MLSLTLLVPLRRYEVRKKDAKFDKAVGNMADTIASKFMPSGRLACGIVYCLSRENCEKVAAELQVMPLASLCSRS